MSRARPKTRAATTRAATVREPAFDPASELGRFELPDTVIPPKGMRYEWKRLETFGKPDGANISRLKAEGWTPVPADRHSELSPKTGLWPGEQPSHHTSVIREGLILCERPEHVCRAVEERIARQTHQITAAEKQKLGFSQDERNFPRLQPFLDEQVTTADGRPVAPRKAPPTAAKAPRVATVEETFSEP